MPRGRYVNFSVNITADTRAELGRLAERCGMTLSDYVRAVLDTACHEQTLFSQHWVKVPGNPQPGKRTAETGAADRRKAAGA